MLDTASSKLAFRDPCHMYHPATLELIDTQPSPEHRRCFSHKMNAESRLRSKCSSEAVDSLPKNAVLVPMLNFENICCGRKRYFPICLIHANNAFSAVRGLAMKQTLSEHHRLSCTAPQVRTVPLPLDTEQGEIPSATILESTSIH
jgi:hypothetical protein